MVFGRGDAASNRRRRENGPTVPGSRARAKHRSEQAQFRIAATVAAATAWIAFVVGCGSGSGDSNTVAGDRSATPGEQQQPADSAAPSTSEGAQAAMPGPDAVMSVANVPPGWRFVLEERPAPNRVLHIFEGPAVDVPNPGGPVGRIDVIVNARHMPGLATSRRASDLAGLATQTMPGVDWKEEGDLTVKGLPAVELTRPVGPGEQRMIFMTMGDWRVFVTGAGVDLEVLRQFAEGVQLR